LGLYLLEKRQLVYPGDEGLHVEVLLLLEFQHDFSLLPLDLLELFVLEFEPFLDVLGSEDVFHLLLILVAAQNVYEEFLQELQVRTPSLGLDDEERGVF